MSIPADVLARLELRRLANRPYTTDGLKATIAIMPFASRAGWGNEILPLGASWIWWLLALMGGSWDKLHILLQDDYGPCKGVNGKVSLATLANPKTAAKLRVKWIPGGYEGGLVKIDPMSRTFTGGENWLRAYAIDGAGSPPWGTLIGSHPTEIHSLVMENRRGEIVPIDNKKMRGTRVPVITPVGGGWIREKYCVAM